MKSIIQWETGTPNNGGRYLIVLGNGIKRKTKRKIERIAPIKWLEVDDSLFNDWPQGWNCSMCHRLVMSEVLKGYGKVIWSDCDVIFASDLSDLYNVDISDFDLQVLETIHDILVDVFQLLLGIFNGGAEDVLGKAIRICTECIGLG